MTNYSQNDEQRVILEAFHGHKPGRFLDIGAYDAKMLSNTRALYELGWGGVMIEPSPECFAGLMREYGHDPRIELVLGAVGRRDDLIKMHMTADALSTSDVGHLERLGDSVKFSGRAYVWQLDLRELLARLGRIFDFVNIDVEGSSAELFLYALDCMIIPPRVYCVEHDHRHAQMCLKASAHGYREAMRSGENCVFVREG